MNSPKRRNGRVTLHAKKSSRSQVTLAEALGEKGFLAIHAGPFYAKNDDEAR